MGLRVEKYSSADLADMIRIWNQVVEEGVAFPQEELLDETSGREFFAAQTYCGVARLDGKVLGLYILPPSHYELCPALGPGPFLRGRIPGCGDCVA